MSSVGRYRVVHRGGAWWIAAGVAGLAAVATLEWTSLAWLAAGAIALRVLDPAVVLDVGPGGLSRGVTLTGIFVGRPRVIAWAAIREVATRWHSPRDYTVLETVVVGSEGERIAFSSRMGLGKYLDLLAEVAARAPAGSWTGITGEVMAERRARQPAPVYRPDLGLVLAVALLAGWALAMPWIFNRP